MPCSFCGAPADVAEQQVALCWGCLHRLGRLIGIMDRRRLREIWNLASERTRIPTEPLSDEEKEVERGFGDPRGVTAAVTHLDLAHRINAVGFLGAGFLEAGYRRKGLRVTAIFFASLINESFRSNAPLLDTVRSCIRELFRPGFLKEK